MTRPLHATLADVVGALLPDTGDVVRVTDVDLDLPVRVRLGTLDGELAFLAELPSWRWTTVFDQRPARLRVSLAATP